MNDTYQQPEHGWTCFHCGETFLKEGAARIHFGVVPGEIPGCILQLKRGTPEYEELFDYRKLQAEKERLKGEVGRQAAMLERDRSLVADCVTSMRKTLLSREWLRLGRGSYEYNDDRWRNEFSEAYDEIMKEIWKLRTVAEDWEGCPKTQAEIIAARTKHPTQEPSDG